MANFWYGRPDIEGLVGTPTGPFGVGTGPALGVASVAAGPTYSATWLSLEPGFATKLRKVFLILQGQGFSPKITSAWRDLATQARLKAEGKTQVSFSFHNNINDEGKPAALAADVIDSRYGYEVSDRNAKFFKALGAAAESLGMTWGGGLTYKRSNPVWAKYSLSWDPSHVQAFPNNALGQIQAQSESVWRALRRGNVAALPVVAVRGWVAVVRSLPWWYWATLGGVVVLFAIKARRRRRRAFAASVSV